VKREGKQIFLWTAVDVDNKEILTFYISETRCTLDKYWFLQKLLRSCTNKPVIIGDKAPWCRWALQRLGLPYKHETFGERNAVEQCHSPFKYRFKRFLKRFPFHSTNTSIERWCLCYVVLFKIWWVLILTVSSIWKKNIKKKIILNLNQRSLRKTS